MLKASEVEWLEDRDYARFHYSCQWCSQYDPMRIMPDRQNVPCMWYATCPCNTNNYDYKDALEFSERVAAKLASWEQELIIPCMETAVCERHPQDCPWCRLKYARLQVEEEMDGLSI